MASQIAGNLAAAGGMPDHNDLLEVERVKQNGEIVGVSVHLIAVPSLGGAAVAAPVVRDHAIALLAEIQHLSVPIVRGQRPTVRKGDRLSFAPVFVENLCSVFCRDIRH
jgi:hypothetical protein